MCPRCVIATTPREVREKADMKCRMQRHGPNRLAEVRGYRDER